jgi:CheY-like chemotaxis protein
MRFNIKRSKGPPTSAGATTYSSSSPLLSSAKGNLINNSFLNPIDILTVDRNSRLTITKKLKKFVHLSPDDKIIFYQDAYNKTIVLKVQQRENVVNNWILIEVKENSVKTNTINSASSENGTNNNNTHVNSSYDDDDIDADDKLKADFVNGDQYKERKGTLYYTPILLLDDDKDILLTLNTFLRSEGYCNVKPFFDSREMLRHLLGMKKALYYRLAIIDIRIPDINGIQVYQMLKILTPPIKTIFLTALDAADELTRLMPEIKSADIMRKPVDQDAFIKTVNDKVVSIG